MTPQLTERERRLIDFEKLWWLNDGAKAQKIHDEFGCSPTVYYMELNQVLGTHAAMAYDPITVKRLLGLRENRARSRRSS